MRFKPPHRPVLLLISALCFSLSFEPLPFWFLAYFFVPLFIAATRDLGFSEGFRSGYLFGMAISFLTLYWVVYVTTIGVILLIIVHALYYAITSGLLAAVTKRYGTPGLILFPFVWVAVEYFRSLTQASFPWLNLSYTQAGNLPIVQLAELGGDTVVSFFIVAMGSLFYLGYRSLRKPSRVIMIFASAFLVYSAVYLWGASRMQTAPADFPVAALQGNIPNEQKWRQGSIESNLETYASLSEQAKSDSAQFVLWPETAVPSYLIYDPAYVSWIESIAGKLNIDILTGALQLVRTDDAKKHYYNSAFFFTPQGMDRVPYNKHCLVPFGEHMPYAEKIDLLMKFREFVKTKWGLDISDFEPGDSIRTFKTNGREFGVLICFEVIYPDFVRAMVNSGAEFLAVITNDDWFGKTAGPYQHAAIPIFRAVENRIWILRAANTGISEIVDPYGRIVAQTKLGERAALVGKIGSQAGITLFQRHGSVLAKICLAVGLMAALFLSFTKGRHD
jgi:apolipoprotein N-acyltransferase